MLRKAILIVLTLTCLGGMVLAEEPGVFLPFYFLYGNVTNPLSPGTVDGHQVVYFQGHPITSVTTAVASSKYQMNIMRARYFSKFSVTPGGAYLVGVAKGADNYGKDPVQYIVSGSGADPLDFVLALNEGAGLLPPAGTVPLTINRSTVGNDIKLSWGIPATNIQIFYQVADSYNKDGPWTPIGSGFDETNRASHYVLHRNQVGDAATDRAVFYKALEAGQPTTLLPDAWAAGKYDINVIGGGKYNFVGVPFVPRTADLDSVFGNQLVAAAVGNSGAATEVWKWTDDSTIPSDKGTFLEKMYLSTTGWLANSGFRSFLIQPGFGYFVYSKAAHDDKRVTLVGDISPITVSRDAKVGEYPYSFMANPYPINLALPNSDLAGAQSGSASGAADQLWGWQLDRETFMDKVYLNTSGAWLLMSGDLITSLTPARGFVYNRTPSAPTGGFNWGLDPYR